MKHFSLSIATGLGLVTGKDVAVRRATSLENISELLDRR
jgi:hypothetical protein